MGFITRDSCLANNNYNNIKESLFLTDAPKKNKYETNEKLRGLINILKLNFRTLPLYALSNLENDQIEGLYSAYRRMKTFSEIEETETFVKLEEIIIKYCGRTINFDISPKNVMDILDKRI